ncbi:sensor histidine kinase [Amycolatopsis panacis]|uniref:histidine kinase n=1 Tax=Amycolatopsis panacis TaxID=2340917 RepID=A0A419I815_9PSEU|nr:histidine kinase [Amycolatopsis panacis]RJQ88218.1 hypothetical protein D5S19_07905 [Amycolatopsis panacis]
MTGELSATAATLVRRQWPVAVVLLVLIAADLTGTSSWTAGTFIAVTQMLVTCVLAVLSVLHPQRVAILAALAVIIGSALLTSVEHGSVGLHVASLASLVVVAAEVIGSNPAAAAGGAAAVLIAASGVQFGMLGVAAGIRPVELTGFGLALCAGSVLGGLFLRGRVADRARAAAAEVAAARQAERLAMAREVHDVVAHHVTSIVVTANAQRWANRDDGTGSPFVELIVREGTAALEATRQLVQTLRFEDSPGSTDLADAVAQAAGRCAVPVDVRIDLPERLPGELQSSALRIVTESLTNVSRHARDATRAVVEIAVTGAGRLCVRVRDDGAPGTRGRPERRRGYGIVGMVERAQLHGGELHAGRSDTGWEVEAMLPVRRP